MYPSTAMRDVRCAAEHMLAAVAVNRSSRRVIQRIISLAFTLQSLGRYDERKPMAATAISSVQLLLPNTILENAWITFDCRTITDFGQGPPPNTANSVDGLGHFLSPGF